VDIFRGLAEADLAALAGALHRRRFAAGALVFAEGDRGETLHLITAGKVRVYLSGPKGYDLTVEILARDEVFGEMALLGTQPRSASVEALTAVETLVLYREDFHRYVRAYPDIAINIMAVLADRLRATTAYAADLVFDDLHGRLALMLVTLMERHGQPRGEVVDIDLKLTQDDLAALLGTRRESISRVVGIYKTLGVISSSRQRITVLKPQVLRQMAARR
jgi:CRP-like cAMP-binding protein